MAGYAVENMARKGVRRVLFDSSCFDAKFEVNPRSKVLMIGVNRQLFSQSKLRHIKFSERFYVTDSFGKI